MFYKHQSSKGWRQKHKGLTVSSSIDGGGNLVVWLVRLNSSHRLIRGTGVACLLFLDLHVGIWVSSVNSRDRIQMRVYADSTCERLS